MEIKMCLGFGVSSETWSLLAHCCSAKFCFLQEWGRGACFLADCQQGCSQLTEVSCHPLPATWPSPQHGSLLFQSQQENIWEKIFPKLPRFDEKTLIYTSENTNFLPTILGEFADSIIHSVQPYLGKHFKLIELLICY